MPHLSRELRSDIRDFLLACGATLPTDSSQAELDRLLSRATERLPAHPHSGSVYTAEREARLMCRLALAEWLSKRLLQDREDVERRLRLPAPQRDFLQALEGVSIIDPACGAGAFLVEMFDLLRRVTHWPSDRIVARLRGADTNDLALRAASLRLELRAGEPIAALLTCQDALNPASFDRNFDIVIGNPPYVRHERIAHPNGTIGKQAYKKAISRWMTQLFPGISVDGRSDLCFFFFLRALSLLRPDGVCCLITTASWLDTASGASLRKLLADNFALRLVMEDESCRAFQQADINPVIALVSASPPGGCARFTIVSQQPRPETDSITQDGSAAVQSRFVEHSTLSRWPHKWGSLHLRASPLATDLMQSGLLAPLGEHSLVRRIGRGIRTGRDDFFCVRRDRAAALGIEPEYLVPLVKSPTEFAHRPPVASGSGQWFLFVCPQGGDSPPPNSGARRYIGQYAPEASRSGNAWWSLDLGEPAEILLPVGFGERLFVVANPEMASAHQRFATLYTKPGAVPILLALLRCSITLYFVELFGRRTLGGGALDIPCTDWRIVPIPKEMPLFHDQIMTAGRPLYDRPCLTVREEMERADQRDLDSAVAAALGLSEAEMAAVRTELVSLTARRLARSERGGRRLAGASHNL